MWAVFSDVLIEAIKDSKPNLLAMTLKIHSSGTPINPAKTPPAPMLNELINRERQTNEVKTIEMIYRIPITLVATKLLNEKSNSASKKDFLWVIILIGNSCSSYYRHLLDI